MLSASTIRRLEIAQRNHRIRKFIVREPNGDGLGEVVIQRNDRSVLRTNDAGARALLYVLPKGRAHVPPLKFVGLGGTAVLVASAIAYWSGWAL